MYNFKKVILIVLMVLVYILSGCKPNHSNPHIIFKDHVSDIAWDGYNLWGINDKTSELYKINPQTGEIISRTRLPVKCPRGICFHQKNFWLTTCEGYLVRVGQFGEHIETITIPGLESGQANLYGIVWVGENLFVMDGYRLLVLDGESYAIKETHVLKSRIYGSLTYDGEELLLVNPLGNLILIDPEYKYVAGNRNIRTSGPPIGITWDGEKLWVAIPGKKKIEILN